jgi:hypothetical protein
MPGPGAEPAQRAPQGQAREPATEPTAAEQARTEQAPERAPEPVQARVVQVAPEERVAARPAPAARQA